MPRTVAPTNKTADPEATSIGHDVSRSSDNTPAPSQSLEPLVAPSRPSVKLKVQGITDLFDKVRIGVRNGELTGVKISLEAKADGKLIAAVLPHIIEAIRGSKGLEEGSLKKSDALARLEGLRTDVLGKRAYPRLGTADRRIRFDTQRLGGDDREALLSKGEKGRVSISISSPNQLREISTLITTGLVTPKGLRLRCANPALKAEAVRILSDLPYESRSGEKKSVKVAVAVSEGKLKSEKEFSREIEPITKVILEKFKATGKAPSTSFVIKGTAIDNQSKVGRFVSRISRALAKLSEKIEGRPPLSKSKKETSGKPVAWLAQKTIAVAQSLLQMNSVKTNLRATAPFETVQNKFVEILRTTFSGETSKASDSKATISVVSDKPRVGAPRENILTIRGKVRFEVDQHFKA